MAPATPPMAVDLPLPSVDFSQGNHPLTATVNAASATNQPGRTRAIRKDYSWCPVPRLMPMPDSRVSSMSDLPEWARRLELSPHPEGGWYRETWRSELTIPQSALPPDYAGPRNAGTAILFLLMPGQEAAWHTVRSAEVWLYHSGGPLLLDFGPEQDSAKTHLLGANIMAGESPQFVIPPGNWQRARPRDDQPCLVSCVVVPGFDFADFTLAAGHSTG